MKMKMLPAAVLAFGLAVTPAWAADLGGNCCADLEERVAELEATTARKGNRKVSLRISGQVSKAIMWADVSGAGSEWRVIENTNSQSRIRVDGSAKVSKGLMIGYVLEIGLDENFGTNSSGMNSLTEAGSLNIRYSYAYLRGEWGSLIVGQASMAGDGVAEMSVAKGTALGSTLLSLGPLFSTLIPSPFDSGRAQLIRYDSPVIADAFTFSAAYANDPDIADLDNDGNAWDVALRFAKAIANVNIAAGIAYRDDDGVGNSLFGSISAMEVKTGLFLSLAYGKYSLDGGPDVKAWHVQGGIERKLFTNAGKTTLYLGYAQLDAPVGGDPYFLEGGINQAIDAAATDLFLNVRLIERDGVEDLPDTTVVLTGVRVKF